MTKLEHKQSRSPSGARDRSRYELAFVLDLEACVGLRPESPTSTRGVLLCPLVLEFGVYPTLPAIDSKLRLNKRYFYRHGVQFWSSSFYVVVIDKVFSSFLSHNILSFSLDVIIPG